jgi:abhydrolase domain-containing protein 2
MLLSEEVKNRYKLNEHEIISAATLPELDEAYTRKVHEFGSLSELYSWSSSINYVNNINKPMIFINSKDDPIVPEPLLEPIKTLTSEYEKICSSQRFVVVLVKKIYFRRLDEKFRGIIFSRR